MRRVRLWQWAFVITMAAVAARALHGSPGNPAHAFLSSEFGLGASDLRDIEQRRAVGRSLPTGDSREVATLAAIHLRVPARYYVDQLQDVVSFKRTEAVQQIGAFGVPARLEDAAGLTIPADQLTKLRRCRPHDCNLQLSSAAIERLSTGIHWQRSGWEDEANAAFRRILVELVNDYRARGAAALMEYTDRRQPLAVARAFEAMIADPPAVLQRFPGLHRHMLQFPSKPDEAVQDVIYWSREKLGPAQVISVTHMAYASLDNPAGAHAVASKQLYGSQYFDASLGLTFLVPDPSAADSAYLVYVNRSRLDVLGGVLGALKRPIVRSRARSAIADHVVKVRDMIERRFAAQRTAAPGSGAGVPAGHR